jgi:hypothetical protein
LQNNPDFKREYDESVIKAYNAQKGKKTISGIKSSSSGSRKISETPRKRIVDFKDADAGAAAFMNEMRRSRSS